MDGAAEEIGRELRRLYAEAGTPVLDVLILRLRDQLPEEPRLTTVTVNKWLRDGVAPDSLAALRAFVGLLNDLALLVSSDAYQVQPLPWWEALWFEAVHGQPRATVASFSDAPAPAPAPAPHATPRAVEHSNAIEGHARITGHSIQAGEINGDVHVHPPPAPAPAPIPTPRVTQPPDEARVVIRVQSGTETIEIYDEGLARYWISARLQMGLGYEQ
ncbi:hypothetical protein ACFYYH_05535 [Streptomyces sp. NPDC002018]|uniref:hypothetical protein n=1 Tax=Streptomyces sp. NPDC002018 TaxID=3364629 RepID=UPI0036ADD80C